MNVITFGAKVQNQISSLTDKLLREIKSQNNTSISNDANEILEIISELDIRKLFHGSGFIGKLIDSSIEESTVKKFQNYIFQVDKISANLMSYKMNVIKQNFAIKKFKELNWEYLKELDLYIISGEEVLAENSNKENIHSLINKIEDLKTSRLISSQLLIQLELLENNNDILIEKIENLIKYSILSWKVQVLAAIEIRKSRAEEAAHLVKEVDEMKILLNNEFKSILDIQNLIENIIKYI